MISKIIISINLSTGSPPSILGLILVYMNRATKLTGK